MDPQPNQQTPNMSVPSSTGNTPPVFPSVPSGNIPVAQPGSAQPSGMPFPQSPVSAPTMPPSTPAPMSPPPMSPMPPVGSGGSGVVVQEGHKSDKMMYVAAIVLFLIALGGVAFLVMTYMNAQTNTDINTNMVAEPTVPMPTEPVASPEADMVSPVPTLSSSNTLESIEADVEATDMKELDSGLTTLEKDLVQ